MLLTGENNNDLGRVVQYDLGTGQVAKDYGSLGIGSIISSARLGNLCFFGGGQSCGFVVVDTLTQRVVCSPVRTAVGCISSLTVWTGRSGEQDARSILVAVGWDVDYSTDRTDMFDVTDLVLEHTSHHSLRKLVVSLQKRQQEEQTRLGTIEQLLHEQQKAHSALIESKDKQISELQSDNLALKESLANEHRKHDRTKSKLRELRHWLDSSKDNSRLLTRQNVILGLVSKCATQEPTQTICQKGTNRSLFETELHNATRENSERSSERLTVGHKTAGLASIENLKAQVTKLRERNKTLKSQKVNLQKNVQTLTNTIHQLTTVSKICADW